MYTVLINSVATFTGSYEDCQVEKTWAEEYAGFCSDKLKIEIVAA